MLLYRALRPGFAVVAVVATNVLLFLAGAILAALTLRDVFETVIVPGGSRTSLRVTRRLVRLLLPLWKLARGKRSGLSTSFAPLVLVTSFVIWILFLTAGFAMMALSVRMHFQPPLVSFFDAAYMVGSAIVTIGVSEEDALGMARWIILGAGFCGLAVMTMAVTYLLQVQNSVSKRDIGIMKLNTAAGEPPSAVTLLERFAAIGNRDALIDVLKDGRNWCATVHESHTAHPSLIYFQSVGTGPGWPAALGALIDLALLLHHAIDDKRLIGPAMLLREEGLRMARDLVECVGVKPGDCTADESAVRQAVARLASAGYALRADADLPALARQRAEAQSGVAALAKHLGKPTAVLVRQM
jgi:hypothetical protein